MCFLIHQVLQDWEASEVGFVVASYVLVTASSLHLNKRSVSVRISSKRCRC